MRLRTVVLTLILTFPNAALLSQSPLVTKQTPATEAQEKFPQFSDVTQRAGVHFRTETSATSQKYLLETMGGGVAIFDYDGDGWMDIVSVNGAQLSDPMRSGEPSASRKSS